jgi:hypothetical protein
MISGLQETDSVIRCIEAGAEDYLPKPFNAVLLRARISACLERKRWRDRERQYMERIELERQRHENLLRNILPGQIVTRLNNGEVVIADRIEQATILFADLVGFTAFAARVTPSVLVDNLNRIVSAFDDLCRQSGIEKIKTIGDAYMAAAGLPVPRPDHAEAFDCEKLLKAMSPDEGGDIELSKLLATAIRFQQEEDAADVEDHFFEVTLEGLANAPETLTDGSKVRDYLSETAPVDFRRDWAWREEIEADYKDYFGTALETIDVFVIADEEKTQIFNPYGDTYEFATGRAQLRSIEFYAGDDNLYWGWVGRISESAAVTDWRTRGLRVRVRNIQVDGTEIFESLFTQVKPSYGRFNTYYVGEIHIDPERVIPNARRDGFEETDEWITIKTSLMNTICQPLATEAYQASKEGQSDVKKVAEYIDRLVERSRRLADNSRATYDQVVELMTTARRLRRRTSSALRVVGDLDEAAVDQGEAKPELTTTLPQEAARNVEGCREPGAHAHKMVSRGG